MASPLLLLRGFSPMQINADLFIAPLSQQESLFWADAQAPEQRRLFYPSIGLFSGLPFSARALRWFPTTGCFLGVVKPGMGGGWGEEGPCVEILQRLKPKPASAAKLALTCHLPGIHPTSWKVDHLQDGPRAKGSRRGRVSGTDR